MKTKNKLKNFFRPESVAIVGASEAEGKVGNAVAKNILKLGYRGEVFLVNPKHEMLMGRKCYPSLQAIGRKVDLAIIVVPAKFVVETVRSGAATAANFVVISAGFSETDTEGHHREQELADLAAKMDLNILGPNCLGFIFPEINLNASFAGGMPEAGNVAVVSQSGALVVALMDIARRERMGFSHLISIGNKMQIDEAALIDLLLDDKKTKVIGLYLEGIKDGRRFMEAAARASGKKPIVVLKAGKSEKAQKAISSHTGALAGSDAAMDELFRRVGVVRAENLENFIDLLKLVSLSRPPRKNNKVAVITNAGGPGVLATDAFLGRKIELAELRTKTKQKLREFLPEESSVENPVDLLGDAQEDRYEKALAILEKEDIGSVICILTPQDQTPVDRIADRIVRFRSRTKLAVATVFIGGERLHQARNLFRVNAVSNFSYPDQAVEALDKYYEWSLAEAKKIDFGLIKTNEKRKKKAAAVLGKAKDLGRKALYFSEAAALAEMYKLPVAAFQNISLGEYSHLRFPLVLKVDSVETLHKMDKRGVVVGIDNQAELERELRRMEKDFPRDRFLVQPMLDIRTEIIVGMKRDPIFGPVVLFGLGGIYTEMFKAVDLLVGPMDRRTIEQKVLASRIGFLFRGARGQKAYDLREITDIIERLTALAYENREIAELDINPLLIYNDRRKAQAVDIKIIL